MVLEEAKEMTRSVSPSNYRQAIIELVTELFPREEHDRWMLTPHPVLNGDWPSIAVQKGNEEEVYNLLLSLKQSK